MLKCKKQTRMVKADDSCQYDEKKVNAASPRSKEGDVYSICRIQDVIGRVWRAYEQLHGQT